MEASLVLDKVDKEIINDLFDVYPQEGCGLLINTKGKIVWKSCTNIADNPLEDFVIDPSEYIEASLKGDIYAIVHSHPDASCTPSEADIKTSNFLGIPYIIYSLPDIEKHTHTPVVKTKPLLGRDYSFGNQDCYSLVRDYYKENYNLSLPTTVFEDDWWDKGLNYFDELFNAYGFVEVEEPKIGDVLIFKIFCNVPNHCGIYIGEDIFLHHAIDRLSCRESLHSGWGKHISRIVRCKQFI